MNHLERRVRGAFDEVELPAEVRDRTFCALDELAQRAPEYSLNKSGVMRDKQTSSDGLTPASAMTESQGCAPVMQEDSGVFSTSRIAAHRTSRRTRWRHAAVALAACLTLAVVGLVGVKLYFDETAYVGIDVNPSVELGINRFDIVVSATALNVDGEALLKEVSITGKSYGNAVETLTSSAAFEPYLQADAFVEISVTADDVQQSDSLRQQSDTCLNSLPCEGESQAVDAATRDAALAVGMGTGRYRAALQLVEIDPSLTLNDCAAMSMRELRERIAEASGGVPSAPSGEGGSDGHGQGLGKDQGGKGLGNGAGRQGSGDGLESLGQGNVQGMALQEGQNEDAHDSEGEAGHSGRDDFESGQRAGW